MKFIVDAHLPPSLCKVLAQHGHEAIHMLELPSKNATKDSVLNQLSVNEERIIISKDSASTRIWFWVVRGSSWW